MRTRSSGLRVVFGLGAGLLLAACTPRTPAIPPTTTEAATIVVTTPTVKPTAAISPTVEPSSPSPLPASTPSPAASPSASGTSRSGTVDEVQVYLVHMGGGTVGCSDRLVPVARRIAPTSTPLKSALRELLSMKTRIDGQSGLYNALYQSRLRVDQVHLQNGKATILLTGQLVMGGECDSPRVEAQLKQTALQFPTVKEVSISIDGTPIEKIVSLR